MIKVAIPWGTFGLNGEWWPNPHLEMSVDEQRRQNVEHGFLPLDKSFVHLHTYDMPTIIDPERVTPLLTILRACSPEERVQFAELAGTTESYLYSMAGATREPLTLRSLAVADASRVMNERSKGRIPAITVEEIGEMFRK